MQQVLMRQAFSAIAMKSTSASSAIACQAFDAITRRSKSAAKNSVQGLSNRGQSLTDGANTSPKARQRSAWEGTTHTHTHKQTALLELPHATHCMTLLPLPLLLLLRIAAVQHKY
uniref:Uncharacterized protein n=1 Tax=Dunaliella tertiolecta TaxID=3047 RepID=A0A7S3QTA1_DUNTE|mmetsp:Transcript_8281/g.20548  ORF Transcript_8281/g.20548 Transcript_8281/m.20548 type:complete len:115 (-) Transcript_8281:900-1244(-)